MFYVDDINESTIVITDRESSFDWENEGQSHTLSPDNIRNASPFSLLGSHPVEKTSSL